MFAAHTFKKQIFSLFIVATLLFISTSCKSGGSEPTSVVTGSCDGSAGTFLYCDEYRDFPDGVLTGYDAVCAWGGDTWSTNACPSLNAVGKCSTPIAGGTINNFFYQGTLWLSAYETSCIAGGGTWTALP